MNELGSCAFDFADFAMLLNRTFAYILFGEELNSEVGCCELEAFCDSGAFLGSD